jgi:hypothetical protein
VRALIRARGKAFAAVLALVALAALPAAASAKPGFMKVPPTHSVSFLAHATHGYFVYFAVFDDRASLAATRLEKDGGASMVTYESTARQKSGDDIDASLGRAGDFKARFLPGKTEELKPQSGCVGGPTVLESGYFVGSMSFRGADGFTSFHLHKIRGAVTRSPAETCHTGSRFGPDSLRQLQEKTLRLIGGDPFGMTSFQATLFGREQGQPTRTEYEAETARSEGAITVRDSVSVPAPRASPFAVPDLTAGLPATTTVEPPAPFSGSATFEAPSRRTATISGDLAVDLPEVGVVPLAGPGTRAGLCRGYVCTASLPKALRPRRPSEYGPGEVEIQTIR